MEWTDIALIVVAVLLILAGGYIKRLTKEIKELVDVFSEAIADKKITREELKSIIKEANDIKATAWEIISAISGLLARKRG